MASAVISEDGLFRYWLERDLPAPLYSGAGEDPNTLCAFVMLNPSTADAEQDDPTIRRCTHFATSVGASQLVVANLYAYRATRPAALLRADDPVGPDNDTHLRRALAAHHVIVAWGSQAEPARVTHFLTLAGATPLWCLGTTQSGAPRHPLYVPNSTRLQTWSPPETLHSPITPSERTR